MKKLVSFLIALTFLLNAKAQQEYEPTWQSIDSRETPQWWKDTKFGIFIHWGLYSVPAYSKLGEYSEWYWRDLVDSTRKSHLVIKSFHEKNYGKNFTYPDFAKKFTCELFDASQWASLFEQSGAKYVVLTSKHHDGYCLWPSKETDESWGRPWSSTNSGPRRDLLGELTNAVRKIDIKMGIYYSLYEWYNPLYTNDIDLFVKKHLFPQFKDVVERYAPSVIFSDGEWEYPSVTWKSKELLTWLFNKSPCKDEVVINDRWGKESREQHGSYYSTEYGSGMSGTNNSWEECRGMAHSFGYSRTENIEDYNSSQKLIFMLIDIVSRGGNFLLDIGPTADGRIPVIMQERLIDLGNWLKVNGESIYKTSVWRNTCQWSHGIVKDANRDRYKSKYDIFLLTINPEPGFAVKEIWFTKKGDILYCICPTFPNEKLIVKNIKLRSSAKISILGINKNLKWKQKGNNIVIEMPKVNPSQMPCDIAYTFKINGIDEK